ncbi:hypothetical protein T265_07286 [Opisthorchis viverrini]|uniref:Protein FAM32A n=1 Tax=Opisthorchis viverrini TaxID=6198 RepID=A0A074ZD45_OPIVI|nr:hypothetical protein T265_07286 [Opisthorchis viverrini]KER25181.1 hypothetical protein T265_07286 [Opisthorchis viverrini]
MSEYDKVVAGSLRIKSGQGIKKKKVAAEFPEATTVADEPEGSEPNTQKPKLSERSHLTKAQKELERRKDKRMLETVLSKAVKSHKQRIIEFNNHLETLTEHFDIQKVSWTK